MNERTYTHQLVQNVVATAYIGEKVDLVFIANNVENVIYNPYKFTAAIIRLNEPKITVLIFNSG
jgi:transcription initiation factor TFIID TATA-box-binding protein